MSPVRRTFLVVPLVAAVIVVVVSWPFEPTLTAADRRDIAALVRARTSEPIVRLRPRSFWRAEVLTSGGAGPLNRESHMIVLRWTFGTWRVAECERLMS